MSATKKKSSASDESEAQDLVNSLLDERTPAPRLERDVTESVQLANLKSQYSGKKPELQAQPSGLKSGDFVMEPTAHFEKGKKSAAFDEATATVAPKSASSAPSFEPRRVSEISADPEAKSLHFADERTQVRQSLQPPTEKISRNAQTEVEKPAPERSSVDRLGITELKTVVKMRGRNEEQPGTSPQPPNARAAGAPGAGFTPGYASSEAALKQSENLRIAQTRLSELEQEVERLRRENEQLTSAGETLRRRSDELLSKVESFEIQQKELEQSHTEEKKVFRGQIQSKDRELSQLRGRLEEMETRLESNFKKIRVRERELEHRLEIGRMETQTLVATKDKMILELKRQVDQLTLEGEYAKQKSQEAFNQYKEKQETIRRTVRALRIALTNLEGEEE